MFILRPGACLSRCNCASNGRIHRLLISVLSELLRFIVLGTVTVVTVSLESKTETESETCPTSAELS